MPTTQERTDAEIVAQTNELARQFMRLEGYEAEPGLKFYTAQSPRSNKYWVMACVAQELLTDTEVHDALQTVLEDEASAPTPAYLAMQKFMLAVVAYGPLDYKIRKDGVVVTNGLVLKFKDDSFTLVELSGPDLLMYCAEPKTVAFVIVTYLPSLPIKK
jgi:hypothetical protein